MSDYFIKTIDGPAGQKGYPEDNLIHFTYQKSRDRFEDCRGFLIYETGGKKHNDGLMAIYAYGFIDPEQPQYIPSVKSRDGVDFPYGVKVILQKRVHPQDGVPLSIIRSITNIKVFQRRGGLITITKEQFDQLCAELDKRTS